MKILEQRPRDVKLAAARGGFDTSLLTTRGIMGVFKDALENAWDQSWASRIGLLIPADAESITHRWLGQTPGVREWVGGLLLQGMDVNSLTIVNHDYETSLEVSLHDLRRDKTAQLTMRIAELASRFVNHWEELLIASLVANPTCYDGQSFFSTSHSSGDSGTLSNLLTNATLPALDVATAARPTREEASAIMVQAAVKFFSYKDDKGKKANQGARQFLILTNPEIAAPFKQASVADRFVTGGTPNQKNLGWEFEVVPEPLITSTDVAYVFRTDAPASRPYILQTEVDPEIKVIGPDSEHAIKNNAVVFSGRATRGIGPGEWRQALKLTLS